MPLSLRTETQRHSMLFFQHRAEAKWLCVSAYICAYPLFTIDNPETCTLATNECQSAPFTAKAGAVSQLTRNQQHDSPKPAHAFGRKSPDAPEKVSGRSGESLRMLRRKSPDASEKVSGCFGGSLRMLWRKCPDAPEILQTCLSRVWLFHRKCVFQPQSTKKSVIAFACSHFLFTFAPVKRRECCV